MKEGARNARLKEKRMVWFGRGFTNNAVRGDITARSSTSNRSNRVPTTQRKCGERKIVSWM